MPIDRQGIDVDDEDDVAFLFVSWSLRRFFILHWRQPSSFGMDQF